MREILESAIRYTINFDLLVPEYSNLMEISVDDVLQIEDQNMIMKISQILNYNKEILRHLLCQYLCFLYVHKYPFL